jgi:two-component system cell cycle sensor histidine kinase PleC
MIKDQLLGPIENEKYVEYSHDINKSGQHLLSIVNDILDVSKIETGKFDLNISIVDPYDILRSCENIIKGWPTRKAKKFITNYESNLPLLEVDARLIKQIIINILSNAVKFTADDGEIILSAGMNSQKEFYISVKDNGIGIVENEIKHVTNAFYQIDGSLTRNQDGTGLGLHLVTKFIELHGGKLEIKSEISQGTLMQVTIPPAHIVLTEENLSDEAQTKDPHETLYFSQTK